MDSDVGFGFDKDEFHLLKKKINILYAELLTSMHLGGVFFFFSF